MMNSNDQKRRQILHWFYDRNKSATSARGKKGASVKISDIKKALKEAHGLKAPDVVSNLTYLIDKGWINESEIEKTYTTTTGTAIPQATTWYRISSAGIDKIEGESEFKTNHRYSGINITASGQNIVTLGDGNVIHASHQKLDTALQDLKRQVAESVGMDDNEKLDASVDIETMRDQLAKAKPDRTILTHLWRRIQQVATLNDFSEGISKISPLIAGLLA
jgi:hypothetical protein